MPLSPSGEAITDQTLFDLVLVRPHPSREFGIVGATLYLKATAEAEIAQVGYPYTAVGAIRQSQLDPDDEEFKIVQGRINAGGAEIRYGNQYPGRSRGTVATHEWELLVENPFENIFGFFEHLAHYGSFAKGAHGLPDTFKFPGALDSTPHPSYTRRTYYKRAASTPSAPDVAFEGDVPALDSAMAALGWTRLVPPGFHPIYKFNIEFGQLSNGMPWWDPSLVVPESGIEISWANRFRMLAKEFYKYESALTGANSPERIAVSVATRSMIGFGWEMANATRTNWSINVYDTAHPRVSRTITGRDAVLGWIVGQMETWAKRGFAVMETTIQSDVVVPILSEPSLTHVADNGSFGETKVGLVERADWSRYQFQSYRAAGEIRSKLTVSAGADKAVVSGGTVTLDGVVSVTDAFGDTAYAWSRVSGTGGTLDDTAIVAPTLTAPILMTGDDPVVLIFKLTATNDGVSESDEVAVTVTAPVETP